MLVLPQARYRCTGCGDCCRGWEVPLLPGEAAQFRGWADGVIPVERLAKAFGRNARFETLAANTHCVALQGDACLLHAAHGPDDKPRACRIYPFSFVETPTEVRVGLSFACPAVVDGEGPTLDDQRADVERLFASAVAGTDYVLRVGDSVPLGDGVMLPWPSASRLLDVMAAAFDEPGDFVRRVTRVGALAALTLARLEDQLDFASALSAASDGREALVDEALAAAPVVDRLSRAFFGTLLSSLEPGRERALGRLSGMVQSLFGGRSLRVLHDGKVVVVALANVERVSGVLPADAEAILVRLWRVSLSSLSFFGDAAFGLAVVPGLDLLTLSTAVAVRQARARAAAAGRLALHVDDVRAAVRDLDAGLRHRAGMPSGLARALDATASLDLLRAELA